MAAERTVSGVGGLSRRSRPAAQPPSIIRGRETALWIGSCLIMVCLSVAFIDRPVAVFMDLHLRRAVVATTLERLPETTTLVPILAFAAALGALLARVRAATVLLVSVLALTSFVLGETAKSVLKFAFGRTWPEAWLFSRAGGHNPSFIADGVYGFFPFHGGAAYASFPSGHMTAACAVMSVAWLLLPKLRPLWALLVAAAGLGLVAMDYHFVSDVIAGFFLGTASGVVVVRIARRARVGGAGLGAVQA
jgi:membrane-associated phospholipid phosphatase